MADPDDIRIEYPAHGTTYTHQRYGAYRYGTYPRRSVLAGQERRTWLGEYDTLAEAQAEWPTATTVDGSGFNPPDLSHLPDDNDDDYFDREEDYDPDLEDDD